MQSGYFDSWRYWNERQTWLDLPQPKLDLLIRLVVQGNGELSRRKRDLFELLPDDALARAQCIIEDEFHEVISKHEA